MIHCTVLEDTCSLHIKYRIIAHHANLGCCWPSQQESRVEIGTVQFYLSHVQMFVLLASRCQVAITMKRVPSWAIHNRDDFVLAVLLFKKKHSSTNSKSSQSIDLILGLRSIYAIKKYGHTEMFWLD